MTDIIYESFTENGKLVYQTKTTLPGNEVIVHKAVQQRSGQWFKYIFYLGRSVGTPIRSKRRQEQIKLFINSVRSHL